MWPAKLRALQPLIFSSVNTHMFWRSEETASAKVKPAQTCSYGGLELKAQSIPHLLALHARARGDLPFIQTWNEGLKRSVSFRTIYLQSIAMGKLLSQSFGVVYGDMCAILSHNSPEYLALSFGIMINRAVSVNLNWRNPPGTLAELVRNTGCRFLFTTRAYSSLATEIEKSSTLLKVIIIEDLDQPHESTECTGVELLEIARAPQLDSKLHDVCAVFFTSGSTSLPKAVPHTHSTLMWLAEAYYQSFPDPYSNKLPNAGTLCFFPYFHVMGYSVNMIFNLYCGIRHFLHDDAANAQLTPALLMRACEQLKPTVLNTTPWMVEGFCTLLENGEHLSSGLSALHFLTYGGAALKPHCGPVLRKFNVNAKCTYGQTELAGAVLFGAVNGDLNALTPLKGITFKLSADDGEDEDHTALPVDGLLASPHTQGTGELVLAGVFCATPGYIQGTAPNARELTRGCSHTYESYSTGDLFSYSNLEQSQVAGQPPHTKWLYYSCREDDVLVHSTGEMTNPLQVELKTSSVCGDFVENCIMVGDGLPSPVMMVELKQGIEMQQTWACLLWQAVNEAQEHQPAYSALSADRIVVLAAGVVLPTSAKGNVQRSKCEAMFASGVDEIEWTVFLSNEKHSPPSQTFDSLDFTRQKSITKTSQASRYELVKMNSYFVAITGIVCAHRSDNHATGMFETGSVWLTIFSIFVGLDMRQQRPTWADVFVLVKLYFGYVLLILPLFRGSASAAIHTTDGDSRENIEDGLWYIPDYDRPGWYIAVLAHVKALTVLFDNFGKRGRILLALILLVIFVYNLLVGIEENECAISGYQQCFSYKKEVGIFAWLLPFFGWGFTPPSLYLRKFLFGGNKAFNYIVISCTTVCIPRKAFLCFSRSIHSSKSTVFKWLLRAVLMAIFVSVLWVLCTKKRHIWIPEDGSMVVPGWDRAATAIPLLFDICVALLGAFSIIQLAPEKPVSVFTSVGAASLVILVIHDDFWLARGNSDEFGRVLMSIGGFDADTGSQVAVGFCSVCGCVLYTCALGRFSLSRIGILECFGYFMLVHVIQTLIPGSGFEGFDEMLGANAGFFLFLATVYGMAKLVRRLGPTTDTNLTEADDKLDSFGLVNAIRDIAEEVSPWFYLSDNTTVNAWLLFVQLYVVYYFSMFLAGEIGSGFCSLRIILTGLYTDVCTSVPVGLTQSHEGSWAKIYHTFTCGGPGEEDLAQ